MMSVKEVKLCMLGETFVGKSSMIERFVYDTFRKNPEPTIGAAFQLRTVTIGNLIHKYQIWDTAGQEKYRAIIPMYYRGAAAAIIVYDITNRPSFTKVKSWITELRHYGEPDLVVAIAGNKSDLVDERDVQWNEAAELAEQYNAIFIETSAKTSDNIESLFLVISKQLKMLDDMEFSRNGPLEDRAATLTLRAPPPNAKKRSCCSSSSTSSS